MVALASVLGRVVWTQHVIAKRARVRDFKSVTDSGEIRVDESVTCLVGKNESGKTAILEPLYRLMPVPTGHPETFVPLRDYPRSRYLRERDKAEEKSPIEVSLELEDEDIAAIEKEFGKGTLTSKEATVFRHYNNKYATNVGINEGPSIKKMVEEAGLDASVAKGASTVAKLRDNLAAVEDKGPAVVALLAKIDKLDQAGVIRHAVRIRIPRFLYFDEYSVLPGRVSIPLLQSRAESALESGERTALALLKLAGVATKDFAEEDYEARKAALEAAGNEITSEVFKYWSQNKNLLVDLDLDFKSPPDAHGGSAPFLDIRIRNLRHQVTLNFSERSRGFVWFFSFLVAFSEYRNSKEPLVLLLDEPGLGLHAAAQADLLRYIEERLAPEHQVIYSTHSPFMVDPTKLHRVRMVEDKTDEGTKVSEEVLGTSRDTVFPLQAALGYELGQTLFVGPDNLVVEGPADYLYLTILSGYLRERGRAALDARWTIVPVGGLDKIPTFVALLGAQLNVAVVMDGSTGGSQKINDLVMKGVIEAKNVVALNAITGGKEADIEDLFDADFYLKLLKDSGLANVAKADLPPGNRIVKRFEQAIGRAYDHHQPARYFLEKQVELLPKLDDPSLERFERLFVELNKLLK